MLNVTKLYGIQMLLLLVLMLPVVLLQVVLLLVVAFAATALGGGGVVATAHGNGVVAVAPVVAETAVSSVVVPVVSAVQDKAAVPTLARRIRKEEQGEGLQSSILTKNGPKTRLKYEEDEINKKKRGKYIFFVFI